MTTANIISIIRVLLIPVFVACALIDSSFTGGMWAAIIIFIVASCTDWIDGYIARKYNQITTFGKFLDPLADKLLVISAALVLCEKGIIGSVPVLIIIARELLVTSLRTVAMGEGVVIAAQKSGKAKTFIQLVGMIFLMTPLRDITLFAKVGAGTVMVWLMVLITVISGIEYFKSFGGVLKMSAGSNDTEEK